MKNYPIKAANIFNNFFIDIVQNNVNKPNNSKISRVHENVSFDTLFLKKIDSSEIFDIINKFKDDTAGGDWIMCLLKS